MRLVRSLVPTAANAGRGARRGMILAAAMILLPLGLVMLGLARTRLEVLLHDTARDQQRAQARLLAESALAVWQKSSPSSLSPSSIPSASSSVPAPSSSLFLTGTIEGFGQYRVRVSPAPAGTDRSDGSDGSDRSTEAPRAALAARALESIVCEGEAPLPSLRRSSAPDSVPENPASIVARIACAAPSAPTSPAPCAPILGPRPFRLSYEVRFPNAPDDAD